MNKQINLTRVNSVRRWWILLFYFKSVNVLLLFKKLPQTCYKEEKQSIQTWCIWPSASFSNSPVHLLPSFWNTSRLLLSLGLCTESSFYLEWWFFFCCCCFLVAGSSYHLVVTSSKKPYQAMQCEITHPTLSVHFYPSYYPIFFCIDLNVLKLCLKFV